MNCWSASTTHRTAPRLIISDYRLRDNAADRLREAQESGFLLLHQPMPNHRLRASIAHLIDAGDKAVA